jgi:hypothetical protein
MIRNLGGGRNTPVRVATLPDFFAMGELPNPIECSLGERLINEDMNGA